VNGLDSADEKDWTNDPVLLRELALPGSDAAPAFLPMIAEYSDKTLNRRKAQEL
jgi:hypothetical protein